MKRCQRCGRAMPEGSTAYAFEFRLFADFDGVVDPEDDESFDRALASALREDARELEEEVYLEGRALLCPACRGEVLEALGLAGGGEEGGAPGDDSPEDGPDTVH